MNILILDDHSLFSKGLGKILEDYFKSPTIDYFSNIKSIDSSNLDFKNYDILITDIELPEEDIFVLFSYLKTNYPATPILVVSMHNKLSVLKKCKELGIEGYVLKDDNNTVVIDAINSILKRTLYYSQKVKNTLNIQNPNNAFLTPKEENILKLLSEGKSNKEIAEQLFISPHTATTHRKNIYKKLNISSISELIAYYTKNYI